MVWGWEWERGGLAPSACEAGPNHNPAPAVGARAQQLRLISVSFCCHLGRKRRGGAPRTRAGAPVAACRGPLGAATTWRFYLDASEWRPRAHEPYMQINPGPAALGAEPGVATCARGSSGVGDR